MSGPSSRSNAPLVRRGAPCRSARVSCQLRLRTFRSGGVAAATPLDSLSFSMIRADCWVCRYEGDDDPPHSTYLRPPHSRSDLRDRRSRPVPRAEDPSLHDSKLVSPAAGPREASRRQWKTSAASGDRASEQGGAAECGTADRAAGEGRAAVSTQPSPRWGFVPTPRRVQPGDSWCFDHHRGSSRRCPTLAARECREALCHLSISQAWRTSTWSGNP